MPALILSNRGAAALDVFAGGAANILLLDLRTPAYSFSRVDNQSAGQKSPRCNSTVPQRSHALIPHT